MSDPTHQTTLVGDAWDAACHAGIHYRGDLRGAYAAAIAAYLRERAGDCPETWAEIFRREAALVVEVCHAE